VFSLRSRFFAFFHKVDKTCCHTSLLLTSDKSFLSGMQPKYFHVRSIKTLRLTLYQSTTSTRIRSMNECVKNHHEVRRTANSHIVCVVCQEFFPGYQVSTKKCKKSSE